MGCNCGKNKINKIAEKYGDEGTITEKEVNPLLKIPQNILRFVLQFAFGLLCGAIIIVMLIPMLIYIILCMMFGKQPTIKLKNINKAFGKD